MKAPNPTPLTDSAPSSHIAIIFKEQQQKALELRHSSVNQRIADLKKLLKAIEAHRPAIYQALQQDLGKPEAEADLTEIFAAVAEIKHSIRHFKKWMKGRKVWPTLAMLGTSAQVRYEPKGVSLIMVPWNYPINLAFGPLSSALAAGCTAIVKPSELTPNLSRVTKEIIESAFDRNQVACIEGEVETANALLELPFDHIFFTGSPRVGKIVMAAAAKHLTSVTLELGGKSPTVIDASANLKVSARNIAWEKFSNNGQTCVAPDYLLVHESVLDDFVTEMKAAIEKTYGNNIEQNPDYGRIVNAEHFQRLNGLLNDAQAKGAKVICGGHSVADKRYIEPTLLLQPALDSRIMEEEIFGPLLPILSYNELDEAIHFINARPKPLALYIFSQDKTAKEKILRHTSSGDVGVNHAVVHFLHQNLPFGGIGNSGIGKAHGHAGFLAFSHERSILEEKFSITHWLFPPYTPTVKILIKNVVRFFS